MEINYLVSEIIKNYTEFNYDKLVVEYIFTLQGSYNFIVTYKNGTNYTESEISNKPIRETVRQMAETYHELKDSTKKFNYVKIEINKDGNYTELYKWDNQIEKQDLLDYAEVFYQWVNERMMSMIFEYEKDNDLVPTEYDSDGDLEYLSSWDSGVFTFHIDKNNNLEYKVVLTKDGKERTLDLPLRDYFVEGILDHYLVTNNELSNEWKPWNTMILKSLHYDIPYDKREEFVNYILE
ncbi:hypothetical protein SAMN02927916_1378 [Flavobacterium anhuiense]|uniref:Uncharacterized protein n=1 Tax=Flavobacterium anhuiense TaxID=459526 RepID=A0ABY0LHU3_9FLAO|nr:hypothetical protein [Flavobacterium anhuiense]SCY18000.1 hypothetical protein SAMN02927916_1378 [Flavobacterium anhuiense]